MSVGDVWDARKLGQAATDSISAARRYDSPRMNRIATAAMDVLDAITFLDIASQPGHPRAALPAASEKARRAITTIGELEPGHEDLIAILRDTVIQVEAIAGILQGLPSRELPNVSSVERALVAPAVELDALSSRWLGIPEWQMTRDGKDGDEQALRHLIEAAGATVGAALASTRQLMRSTSYFVIPA